MQQVLASARLNVPVSQSNGKEHKNGWMEWMNERASDNNKNEDENRFFRSFIKHVNTRETSNRENWRQTTNAYTHSHALSPDIYFSFTSIQPPAPSFSPQHFHFESKCCSLRVVWWWRNNVDAPISPRALPHTKTILLIAIWLFSKDSLYFVLKTMFVPCIRLSRRFHIPPKYRSRHRQIPSAIIARNSQPQIRMPIVNCVWSRISFNPFTCITCAEKQTNNKCEILNIIRISLGDDLKNNIGWIPWVFFAPFFFFTRPPPVCLLAARPTCACQKWSFMNENCNHAPWPPSSVAFLLLLLLLLAIPIVSCRLLCPLVRLRFASFAMQYGSSNSFHIIIIIIVIGSGGGGGSSATTHRMNLGVDSPNHVFLRSSNIFRNKYYCIAI